MLLISGGGESRNANKTRGVSLPASVVVRRESEFIVDQQNELNELS